MFHRQHLGIETCKQLKKIKLFHEETNRNKLEQVSWKKLCHLNCDWDINHQLSDIKHINYMLKHNLQFVFIQYVRDFRHFHNFQVSLNWNSEIQMYKHDSSNIQLMVFNISVAYKQLIPTKLAPTFEIFSIRQQVFPYNYWLRSTSWIINFTMKPKCFLCSSHIFGKALSYVWLKH